MMSLPSSSSSYKCESGVTMVFVIKVHVLSVCIELKESECAEKERE